MSEIKTVQFIMSTLGKAKPVNLENLHTADLRYLKDDVCEFSGASSLSADIKNQTAQVNKRIQNFLQKKFAHLKNSKNITDEELINRLKNEKVSDMGGTYQRFGQDSIDGILELCKKDKELVLNLIDQKAPHYLKGYPDEARFTFNEIKKLVNLASSDKSLLFELINAKNAKGRPKYNARQMKDVMELFNVDPNTAKQITNMDISEDIIRNLLDLSKTNPDNYHEIIETGVLNLIKEGKVNAKILDNLGENKSLSKNILNDIQKIRENTPAVKVLSKETSIENISKYVKNGDVCEHNSTLYVNDNGKPVKLAMTKEKFEELFPLIDSSCLRQGNVGDCWLVSFLDSIMSKAKGRATIYKSIRQEGNDIIVQFNGSKKSIRFKNGELYNSKNETLEGPKGLQFIEQAFAIHRRNHYTKGSMETDALQVLTSNKNIMSELDDGVVGEAYDAIIADKLTPKKFIKELFAAFRDDSTGQSNHYSKINKYANNDDYVLLFHMKDKKNIARPESLINSEYNLYSEHGYTIKGYNKEKETVEISNPWNTEITTKVPVDTLLEYINSTIPLKINV